MRKFNVLFGIAGVVCALVLAASIRVSAQAVTGTILGTVTDASGARVPGATIKAVNSLTGISRTTTADSQGDYIFPALTVGQYRIEADVSGFQRFVREGVGLSVNQNARVDVVLRLGQVTQSVVVKQNAPLVDTHDVQIGGLVDRQRVEDLPLNGRNVYSLVTLLPGVTSVSLPDQPGPLGGTNMNVNGARTTENAEFLLDGGYNAAPYRNSGNLVPNPDAVEEFRLLTSNYDAQYGRSAGGVVNVVVRSGSNQVHGSAYDFLRNNAFDARSFFEPSVSKLQRNQFGGTIGGPLRHDKLFGFFAYQGDRIGTGDFTNSALPPTLAERSGDFSALPSSKWPKDPGTGKAFAGGIIPTTKLDPVAQNILKQLIPLPNTLDGRYQAFENGTESNDQYIGKGDYQITPSHHLSGTLFFVRGSGFNPFPSTVGGTTNIPNYSPEVDTFHQDNAVVNETWSIRPTLLNQALLSFSSDLFASTDPNLIDWQNLGSNFIPTTSPPRTPQIEVSGAWQGGNYGDNHDVGQSFEGMDAVTWIRGPHTMEIGSSLVYVRDAETSSWLGSGQVAVTGIDTGNSVADFLLGHAATFRVNNGNLVKLTEPDWSSFIQDDWKIARKLTLDLGLRYEINWPYTSGYNNLQTFRFGSPLPQSTQIPTAPPGLLYNGDPGIPAGLVPTPLDDFAPRVGFALDPFGNGKTAIRAGYGIFYAAPEANMWQNAYGQPYLVDVTDNVTPSFVNPFGNFPSGNPFPLNPNVAARKFAVPLNTTWVDPDYSTPYFQQYSFTVQQQLRPNLDLEAGYVGNTARHLTIQRDVNQPVFIPGAGKSTAANINNRRPILPGTYAEIISLESGDNSSYNALTVSVDRRFAQGFTLLANYTWSKAMDDADTDPTGPTGVPFQNSNIRSEDWSVSGFDRAQVFNLSALWQVPGTRQFGFAGRELLSGWQANAIGRLASGSPFSVTAGKDTNLNGVNTDRPDLVSAPYLSTSRPQAQLLAEYFDPAAFLDAAAGLDGTAGRNILFGPGSDSWDVSLFKDFPIHESHQLQFRAEFFNFFNTPNFNNPTSNLNSGNVGRILGAGAGRVIQFALRYSF
ncbi:MAG: carboxypeptidase regulatory-like domain-containing protein [Terriglobia bacterium]